MLLWYLQLFSGAHLVQSSFFQRLKIKIIIVQMNYKLNNLFFFKKKTKEKKGQEKIIQ